MVPLLVAAHLPQRLLQPLSARQVLTYRSSTCALGLIHIEREATQVYDVQLWPDPILFSKPSCVWQHCATSADPSVWIASLERSD